MAGHMPGHDYDMMGHQPGCALCARQKAEQWARDRAAMTAKNTLSRTKVAKVTVTVEIKIGTGPATKASETFSVPAGGAFNPTSCAAAGQSLAFKARDAAKAKAS
jgi:hypothetical protein